MLIPYKRITPTKTVPQAEFLKSVSDKDTFQSRNDCKDTLQKPYQNDDLI